MLSLASLTDQLSQPIELFCAEHARIDHARNQLLDRTVAQPVNDLPYGARGKALRGLCRVINEAASIDGVAQVAFLFEAAEQGANGRFLELALAGDCLMYGFDRRRSGAPDGAHDFVFEVGKGGANG